MGLFMTAQWLIAIFTVSLAGFIRGFSGFGSAMIIIPVLSLVFGTHAAATVAIVTETLASAGLIPGAIRKAEWRSVAPMAMAGIIMVPVGAYALAQVEPILISRVVSIIVMIVAVLMLAGWQFASKPMLSKILGAGAISGALTGIGGMGGPPVVLYFLSRNTDQVDVGRANCIAHLSLVQVIALGIYVYGGLMTGESLRLSLWLTLPFCLGVFLGSYGFKGVDSTFYRNVVLSFLLIVGLTTLLISF